MKRSSGPAWPAPDGLPRPDPMSATRGHGATNGRTRQATGQLELACRFDDAMHGGRIKVTTAL